MGKAKAGISLIELVAVVAIFSGIVGMIFFTVSSWLEKARISRLVAELRELEHASWEYWRDTGDWPKSNAIGFSDVSALISKKCVASAHRPRWDGPYIDRLPKPFLPNVNPYSVNPCLCSNCVSQYNLRVNATIPGNPKGDGNFEITIRFLTNADMLKVARKLDEEIDGVVDGSTGKVRYTASGTVLHYVVTLTTADGGFLMP